MFYDLTRRRRKKTFSFLSKHLLQSLKKYVSGQLFKIELNGFDHKAENNEIKTLYIKT